MNEIKLIKLIFKKVNFWWADVEKKGRRFQLLLAQGEPGILG